MHSELIERVLEKLMAQLELGRTLDGLELRVTEADIMEDLRFGRSWPSPRQTEEQTTRR